MYDPRNVAPQVRQGPQMSMPPAQQNLPPYFPSTFQIGATTPQSYMVRGGSSSIPAFVDQSDSTVYSRFPCIPISLTGTLNSTDYMQYFVSGQQDPQWNQCLHHMSSQIPFLTSPNGAEMLRLPPPPPLLGHAPSRDLVYTPHPVGMPGAQNTSHLQRPQSSSHTPSVRLLPLPPPPPYPVERPPLPPSSPSEPPPLPPLSPSLSSPHASHINQTSLYTSHEGMKHGDLLLRSLEVHNLHEESQHSGSCSRRSQLASLRNTDISHLDADSDVDMEDDITQVDNEHIISDQLHEPQTVPARDSLSHKFLCSESSVFEEQIKESNEGLIFTASSEISNENHAAAAEGGKHVASEPVTGSSPIRLIQGCSADNSLESNLKPCPVAVVPAPVLKYVKVTASFSDVGTRLSPDMVGNVGCKPLWEYDKGFGASESVVACSKPFELAKVFTKADQSKDNKHGNQEPINYGIPKTTYLHDAFRGSGIDATPESGTSRKEDQKCMPTQMKIDVFERCVKENASNNNYDDLGYSRRRDKGGQSQMQGQSHSRSYDPLFDGVEHSSNSSTPPSTKKCKTDDCDIVMPSVSNELLQFIESNKEEEAGSAALSTSLDSSEYDQTARELTAVNNENSEYPVNENNRAVIDFEIDQVKTSRKRMKDKSSRSINRFKVSLSKFVKGVLKPSWREGNMSKEVFKVIVKRTVDKVSRAMKKHHIPKTEEKIKRYIDLSHKKLTNLVMGYVEKYVRV